MVKSYLNSPIVNVKDIPLSIIESFKKTYQSVKQLIPDRVGALQESDWSFVISAWNTIDKDTRSQVLQAVKGCKFAGDILMNRTTLAANVFLRLDKISADQQMSTTVTNESPEYKYFLECIEHTLPELREILNKEKDPMKIKVLKETIGESEARGIEGKIKARFITRKELEESVKDITQALLDPALEYTQGSLQKLGYKLFVNEKGIVSAIGPQLTFELIEVGMGRMKTIGMYSSKFAPIVKSVITDLVKAKKSDDEIKKIMKRIISNAEILDWSKTPEEGGPAHTIENLIKFLNESGHDVTTRDSEFKAKYNPNAMWIITLTKTEVKELEFIDDIKGWCKDKGIKYTEDLSQFEGKKEDLDRLCNDFLDFDYEVNMKPVKAAIKADEISVGDKFRNYVGYEVEVINKINDKVQVKGLDDNKEFEIEIPELKNWVKANSLKSQLLKLVKSGKSDEEILATFTSLK